MSKEPDYKPDPNWIGKDYYSTPELAKAASPALLKGMSCGLFRTLSQAPRGVPPNHFIVSKMAQKDFTKGEAQDLARDWENFTGHVLMEYSDGKGHWACLDAPAPRKRLSFTLQHCDEELDELRTRNGELEVQLKLAMNLVKACTPIVMNYVTYQQLGMQIPFPRWLIANGQDELKSRQEITVILSDKRWKEIKTK